jgi:cyclic lactone autoinducer peptide
MNFDKIPHKLNFCSKIKERQETTVKKIIMKISGLVASLALMVTIANVNSSCMFVMHQPKLPKGAEKLRKF